ncbi:hypothetical protein RB213_001118 [Colletotrichum asianum]
MASPRESPKTSELSDLTISDFDDEVDINNLELTECDLVERKYRFERAVDAYLQYHTDDNETRVVLTAFKDFLPNRGKVVLFKEVEDYAEHSGKIEQLSRCLVKGICTPLKSSLNPTYEIPRPTFQGADIEIEIMQGEIRSSKRPNGLREKVLARDGFRCAVTDRFKRARVTTLVLPKILLGSLHVCHIIPHRLGEFDDDAASTKRYATIWVLLHRFFPKIAKVLGPEQLGNAENAFAMWSGLHKEFDDFRISFEPRTRKSEANTYNLRVFGGYAVENIGIGLSRVIRFKPATGDPPPNAICFDVHHRVARILDRFKREGLPLKFMGRVPSQTDDNDTQDEMDID